MDETSAGSAFEARLDVRSRSRLLQITAVAFWGSLGALTMGRVSAPAPDVVVRRRTDGHELLRLYADSETEAVDLLGRVRADLGAMGVPDFCSRWTVEQPV